jgi:hypothetical protein
MLFGLGDHNRRQIRLAFRRRVSVAIPRMPSPNSIQRFIEASDFAGLNDSSLLTYVDVNAAALQSDSPAKRLQGTNTNNRIPI